MFVQKLENETSLTLEEMEMTNGGGDGCPGVQNYAEFQEVLAWLLDHGYGAQESALSQAYHAGKIQFAPAC